MFGSWLCPVPHSSPGKTLWHSVGNKKTTVCLSPGPWMITCLTLWGSWTRFFCFLGRDDWITPIRRLKTGLMGDGLIPTNHLLLYLGPLLFFRVPFSPVLSARAGKQAWTYHIIILHAQQRLGTGVANCLLSFETLVHSAFSLSIFLMFLFWPKWPQVLTMQW